MLRTLHLKLVSSVAEDTFADKRNSLVVIQIQEALWRKLYSLKPHLTATKSINFGSEGPPETKPTENQYACHDLSV